MFITSAAPTLTPAVSDEDVLVAARGFAERISDAELGLVSAALEWAHRNPGWFLAKHEEAWGQVDLADLQEWEEIAEDGCVFVDEMSLPEFAYATGQSERVVRSLVQDAVVMFYRFPRTWARMTAGQVPVWRARIVPRLARGLPARVASYVDRHLDQPGARYTRPQVQRLIDEARLRFVPDEVAAEVEESAERRRVEIDTQTSAHNGLANLEGVLELPDALELEAAIAHGAVRLKEAGSTDPLHVRRSHALGDLARSAQVPDLGGTPLERESWDGTGVPRTGVKIYIHLNHTALKCQCTPAPEDTQGQVPPTPESRLRNGSPFEYMLRGPGPKPGPGVTAEFLLADRERDEGHLGEAARVDGTGMPTLVLDPGLIRRWFTRPTETDPRAGPKVTVRQVVDPDDFASTEAYEVPERIKDAVTASQSRSCVFPYCQVPSSRAQCDHITPFDEGGPTCSCNLAPLCGYHHRVKTHGQHHETHKWTYAPLGRDAYIWFGPNSIRLLRTPNGTQVLPGDIFTRRASDGTDTPGVRRSGGSQTSFDEDHEAYDVVTAHLALPRLDDSGTPIPADPADLARLATALNSMNLDSFVNFERYSARGGGPRGSLPVHFGYIPPQPIKLPRKQRPAGEAMTELMALRWEQNKNIQRRDPYRDDDKAPEPADTDDPPPF